MTVSDKAYSNKAGNWKSSIVVTDNGKKLSAGKDFLKNVEYTYAYIPEGEKIYDGYQKSKPILERTLGDAVGDKDIVPVNTIIKAKVTAMGKLYTGYTETSIEKMSQIILREMYQLYRMLMVIISLLLMISDLRENEL